MWKGWSCCYVTSFVLLPLVSIYIVQYIVIHCSCRSARGRAWHSTWEKYTTLLWIQMVNYDYCFNDHYMANCIVIIIETIFIWPDVSFLRVFGCLRVGIVTILGCPGIGSLNMPWLKIIAARRLTYNQWSQAPFMCSRWVFCKALHPLVKGGSS